MQISRAGPSEICHAVCQAGHPALVMSQNTLVRFLINHFLSHNTIIIDENINEYFSREYNYLILCDAVVSI